MVFTVTNLLQNVPCPEGERCSLTSCVFGHLLASKRKSGSEEAIESSTAASEPATKRRKISYERASDKPPSRAEVIRENLDRSRQSARVAAANEKQNGSDSPPSKPNLSVSSTPPHSLSRNVSPPHRTGPLNSANSHASDPSKPSVRWKLPAGRKEALNPRLLARDPVGHPQRSKLLKIIHDELVRLNKALSNSDKHVDKRALKLDEQELITLALDEEEKVAREQPKIYGNVVRNRILHYKKLSLEDWINHIRSTLRLDENKPKESSTTGPSPVDTGLSPSEENSILPRFVADQTKLAAYGYTPVPPTEAQAAEAAAAVKMSCYFEVCDRCERRFQIFPDRSEDGDLTSHGRCIHHPRRKAFPPKSKTDHYTGPKEPYFPCCGAVVGSEGCTRVDNHVFKAGDAARLSAVMPFITTPENPSPKTDRHGEVVKAVTFDCEMGYTVYGLELIRLTAVQWPSGEELLDVLVRPIGAVIDLNSRFSGVWPEHYVNAVRFEDKPESVASSSLGMESKKPGADQSLPNPGRKKEEGPTKRSPPPLVSSPSEARALLLAYLTPLTPLIGHAIENDLNAIRLCHPTIVDTVLLFPHVKGLPMRLGLKNLAFARLGWRIQEGGDERGHDSLEDARATGELVRWKVREEWGVLKSKGWRRGNGKLFPPEGGGDGEDGTGGHADEGGVAKPSL